MGDFDPEAAGDKLANVTHHAVLDFGLWYAAKGTTPLDLDPTTHVVFGWCLHFFILGAQGEQSDGIG